MESELDIQKFIPQFDMETEMNIKKDIPQFDMETVIDFTKGVVLNIYNSFVNEDLKSIRIRISDELINKITKNKELYRISKNFDRVAVERVGLIGYEKKEDGIYVKIFANVNFFDDVDNNLDGAGGNDKFWYDRWIITYKAITNIGNNCQNCGAEMEYNKETNSFECKYCRSVFFRDSKDWKVIDIEVQK
ncbi:MAG: hypothetical protein IKG56_00585 [Clostridia bacterium]|nr:hypothetical protein [Clostridia bacterium]